MTVIVVPRGQQVSQVVPVVDPSTGLLDRRWVTDDTPAARVWAGQDRPHAVLSAAWSGNPADGAKISITVTAAVSGTLTDGRWPVDLLVTSGATTSHVGGAWLSVVPSSSASPTESAPRSYITSKELRDVVGPMIDATQTRYDQASVANVLALATADLDDTIARRYVAGLPAGQVASGYDDMIARLANGGLTVTSPVKRYVAWRALWYMLARTTGGNDDLVFMRRVAEEESQRVLRRLVAVVGGIAIKMGGEARLSR